MPKFSVGDRRYRPGFGTYGYEDSVGLDGRVPGVVVGFSPQRVRVELALSLGRTRRRSVDAASLALVEPAEGVAS